MHAALTGALTGSRVLTDVGHGLRESFYMFWATLWAIVLGFAVSGAVQAFASREAMHRQLGSHRPAPVVRASLFGMVSSSCSYAASAMARSLFVRGADYVAAMVFMFASTNLVFELGIVLVVLIGWQFLAAEFVGGAVMIALLVLVGGLWFRGRALEQAREVAMRDRPDPAGPVHATDADDGGGNAPDGWRRRMRSKGGWADAASYTISDLTMIRKEMAIGFVAAGFLSGLVPVHFWNDVFVHGHGFWTSIENVAVGPFVALISFVCSIGNVPLAAALWKGGISFGGVVSFVFADLISLPLLLIYRKQYGTRMMLRMLWVFWAVMSLAGLATQYLFQAFGWIPPTRPTVIAGDSLRWNYVTGLDILALFVLAGAYWLYRHQEHLGGGTGYSKDPVCGMQVEVANAPAHVIHEGAAVYFCSERCCERFQVESPGFLSSQPMTPVD